MTNDSTGIVLPFESAAIAGCEMPGGLTSAEQRLFLSLRMLYHQKRTGIISRETAVLEKKKLLKTFELDKFRDKCGAHTVSLWKNIEEAGSLYGRERTLEHADRFYRTVYGLKPPDISCKSAQ